MRQKGFTPILIIIVLVLIGFAGFYLIKFKSTETSPNSSIPNFPKTDLLAYSEGHQTLPSGGVVGGDLWIINPENLRKQKITTNSSIAWVHDWSPDGRHIAVVLNEKKDFIISSIAVVEVDTGNVSQLKEVGSGIRGRLFWSSNDEIVYLRSDIPNDTTLSTISITDKAERNLIVLPKELTNDPQFSSDKQWVVAGDSLFETGKIYSFNTTTKQKNTLTDIKAYFGGWIYDKVIYATQENNNNGVWEVGADGSNKRKLVDLGKMKTSSLITSVNGSKIVYVATSVVGGKTNQKLYSYDYSSGVVSKPYVEENTPGGISGVKVSRNGRYVSYYQSSQGIKLINLESGEINDVCNDVYCDASWFQN